MQQIASFTKIQGSGNVQAIVNGVVNNELMRQRTLEHKAYEREKRAHEREIKCLEDMCTILKRQRNRLMRQRFASAPMPKHTIKDRMVCILALPIVLWDNRKQKRKEEWW